MTKREYIDSSVPVRGKVLTERRNWFGSREESDLIYLLKEFRDIYESKLKTQAYGKECASFSS